MYQKYYCQLYSDLGPAMGSLQERWKSSSIETLAESSFDFAKYCSIFARSSMSMRAAFFVFVLVLTCNSFKVLAPCKLWQKLIISRTTLSWHVLRTEICWRIWDRKKLLLSHESLREVARAHVETGKLKREPIPRRFLQLKYYLFENNFHHKFLVETSCAALSPIVSFFLFCVWLVPAHKATSKSTFGINLNYGLKWCFIMMLSNLSIPVAKFLLKLCSYGRTEALWLLFCWRGWWWRGGSSLWILV